MCLSNAEDPSLSVPEWSAMFPSGFPAYCTDIDGLIDVEALLPNTAKGKEKEFRRWATTRNAEIVQQRASCRLRGVFPLLSAMLRERNPEDQTSSGG